MSTPQTSARVTPRLRIRPGTILTTLGALVAIALTIVILALTGPHHRHDCGDNLPSLRERHPADPLPRAAPTAGPNHHPRRRQRRLGRTRSTLHLPRSAPTLPPVTAGSTQEGPAPAGPSRRSAPHIPHSAPRSTSATTTVNKDKQQRTQIPGLMLGQEAPAERRNPERTPVQVPDQHQHPALLLATSAHQVLADSWLTLWSKQ